LKNNHRKITIVDPSRWGLKYTERRQWYYKTRLDFFSDPLIHGLKNDTKILFLAILTESLRSNGAASSMCLEYARGLLSTSLGVIKDSLKELERNNIISLQTKVRNQLREENRIEENRSKEIVPTKVKTTFDFNSIYQEYPKKEGKKRGIEILNKTILNEVDFTRFSNALRNYVKLKSDTDYSYLKMFSSFVGCWEDYETIDDKGEAIKTPYEQAGEFLAGLINDQ